MMFTENDYKKPITKELADSLKKFTSVAERTTVSEKYEGVGVSLITRVIHRSANLNENNAPAITELTEIAFENGQENNSEDKKLLKYLKKLVA